MALADFSLAGKKAIVVGGRRNMGKGFALGLAEAGADVIVTDVNTEDGALQSVADEIADMGRRSLAIKTDISKKSEVDALVARAMDELGGIDILMNVAVRYHRKSLLDLDDQGWDELTDVNLKGYWNTHQAVAPIMQAQGSGSDAATAGEAAISAFLLATSDSTTFHKFSTPGSMKTASFFTSPLRVSNNLSVGQISLA